MTSDVIQVTAEAGSRASVLRVLHVAPHPDDESLGAPCTLLRLADVGGPVVVAACGLGRPDDRARRRRELTAATRFGGLALVVRDPPAPLRSSDDLGSTQRLLAPWIVELMDRHDVDVVMGPHLHDAHPAHEAVARAIRDAVPHARRPPLWWAWGIWADLRIPTLLVPCSDDLVGRAVAMLRCHAGELARNDYVGMLDSAHRLDAIRGVERVLGFGAAALPGVRHAELLTELGWIGGRWRFGEPRVTAAPGPPAGWGADATDYVCG